MQQEEFKTTVISFDKNDENEEVEVQPTTQVNVNDPVEDNGIKNVLFNITTKVPHVTTSIPAVEVEEQQVEKKSLKERFKLNKVEQVNKNAKFIPKFYLKELHRYFRLLCMWILITLAVIGFETWALITILNNENLGNLLSLLLIPGLVLSIAFLIVYANNYANYRSEARNVDFSKEKLVTTNVTKLYKRLKTGYININWFCLMTYIVAGLCLLINYMVAFFVGTTDGQHIWGLLDPSRFAAGNAYLFCFIIDIIAFIVAFIAHVGLLVTNYVRAAKIDNFYAVQIVSDEELEAIKKKKNKRDAIIFIAVIVCVALIGILIYKIVTSKKNTNTVTINN